MSEQKTKYVLNYGNHTSRKYKDAKDPKKGYDLVKHKEGDIIELTDAQAANLKGKIRPVGQVVNASAGQVAEALKAQEADFNKAFDDQSKELAAAKAELAALKAKAK